MFSLLLMAAGFPAYGPPANINAFTAMTDRIIERAENAGMLIDELTIYDEPSFPADVRVERCVRRADKQIGLPNGAVFAIPGYDCIVEVWPRVEAAYRTSGFFYHDGFEWRYHGAVRESNTPPLSSFIERSNGERVIVKEGSVLYEGDPDHPLNRGVAGPYEELFRRQGWPLQTKGGGRSNF